MSYPTFKNNVTCPYMLQRQSGYIINKYRYFSYQNMITIKKESSSKFLLKIIMKGGLPWPESMRFICRVFCLQVHVLQWNVTKSYLYIRIPCKRISVIKIYITCMFCKYLTRCRDDLRRIWFICCFYSFSWCYAYCCNSYGCIYFALRCWGYHVAHKN